jgi:hypothetical protein
VHGAALHQESHVREGRAVNQAPKVGEQGGLRDLAGEEGGTEIEGPKVIEAGKEGGRRGGKDEGKALPGGRRLGNALTKAAGACVHSRY